MESGVITLELWIIFFVILSVTIAIDLGLFHKIKRKLSKTQQTETEHVMSSKEALGWTLTWISLAGVFAAVIYFALGNDKMIEFVTGYALEKSLSVDNMFVFLLVFTTLGIPHKYQHRVLSFGILSAIAMRIVLILVGASLLDNFHWMIYIFGGLLWYTSIRMIIQKEEKKIELEKNIAVRILKKFMPVNLSLVGNKFIVPINGVMHATPLLVALAIIELTDLVFAMDSIPAVLAITRDPFIVITSRICDFRLESTILFNRRNDGTIPLSKARFDCVVAIYWNQDDNFRILPYSNCNLLDYRVCNSGNSYRGFITKKTKDSKTRINTLTYF